MATINYNGMELEEVTTPQIFDPPRKCLVWDNDVTNWKTADIIATLALSSQLPYRCLSKNMNFYKHCALLPDPPKPRRATNRELARWLAQGNGEWKLEGPVSKEDQCSSDYVYLEINENYKLDCDILVRKWEDDEWHEPTVDYIGIDDKDYNFNKKYGEV